MASIFYQTLMYFSFCCTCGVTFFAVFINCSNVYKSVCVSAILWSVFLFALTEGLSFFKAITATNLMIAWGIFLIIVGGYCLTKKNLLREKINSLRHSAVSLYNDNGASVKALIIFIAFFMLARTVLAVITVSTDYDSMVYHLARVVYWIQYRNVDYYDTYQLPQLFSPVFAEYIQLHVFLITGGDLFANMLQNFSGYGCLILLYGTIRKLGLSIKWALFGCILALSMNIFCAESLAPQVDLVSAFYLMILTYLIVEVLYQSKLTIFQFILLGLVSGFIYIIKTNACAPAAVIIIYMVLVKLSHRDLKIIPLGIISLIFIAAIVFPTFYRNYNYFNGDFMARINVGRIAIGTALPKHVLVNVAKNLGTIGVEKNVVLQDLIRIFAKIMKVDINANEISLYKKKFSLRYAFNIGSAGAHIITPLFLITTVISSIYFKKRRTLTDGFMFALTLQLFSILIILRWQSWGSRLILPALVVVVIPIVYYFSEITKRFDKNSWKYKACLFLVLELIFQCGTCSMDSLIYHTYYTLRRIHYPRYARHWGLGQNSDFFKAYDKFSQLIDEENYHDIGLDGDETYTTFHYPILAKYIPQGRKVECVTLLGNDRKARVLNPNFRPNIILMNHVKLNPEEIYTCNGNNYKCVYNVAHYSIWVKN